MQSYVKNFIKEEEGVEAMEWMAIVGVAAILIVIAAKCGNKLQTKLKNIASNI